jgi:hypothetical protein
MPPSAITITQAPTTSSRRVVIITGTNTTDIATVQISGVMASVIQPTSTSWRAEIRLAAGVNTVVVNGIDISGNITASLTRTITFTGLMQVSHQVLNSFDEFGLLLSLPRLPGEKNLFYRNRLSDVNFRPADTTVRGFSNGVSRELGFQMKPAMNISSVPDGNTGQTRAIDGVLRVNAVFLDLSSTRFYTRDCLVVEPATQSITLTQIPASLRDLMVTTLDGELIDPQEYVFDPRTLTIRFLISDYNDLDLYVGYFHLERLRLSEYTLGTLKTAIETFTNDDGPLFSVTLLADENIPAEDLVLTQVFVEVGQELPIQLEYSPVRVRELLDPEFQDAQYNDRGHAIGTKLELWAKRINNEARVVWGAAHLGRSQWEPLGEKPRLGALPHLSDAERGYWRCSLPTHTTRHTRKDFRRLNGICPNGDGELTYHGVLPSEFQSGTGTRDDCKVLAIVELE